MSDKCRVACLISGRGSNLQALMSACADTDYPASIVCVISNQPKAKGLEHAAAAGIKTETINHRSYENRRRFDTKLAELIDRYRPDLVVLAGFMRILTEDFVNHYEGRLMNIHPSLLPQFPGLDTHERALASGATTHGCTVHFVTTALDAGPIIVQARVTVVPGDDAERLAARVLQREHEIYPLAVKWFAEGRLTLEEGVVSLDGEPIPVR